VTPRFPFVPGRRYAVVVDGRVALTVVPPVPDGRRSDVRVVGLFPSSKVLPRNLLRIYVCFSGAMSDGDAAGIVFEGLDDTFFQMSEELWDPSHTRLTRFLDPARIKRGLAAHEALGYPLREGDRARLIVGGMHDASGAPVDVATFDVSIGPDLRHRLDPQRWRIMAPRAETRQPLTVEFDRPLDHGLLRHALQVAVPGTADIAPGETRWSFVPQEPWSPGRHALVIDTTLEDVAGNSLRRAFDRDLTDPRDEPRSTEQVHLDFDVR
jgi:hypothetical protein